MIITSTKAPTTSTPGAVGDIILNPETGDVYKCTAIGNKMSDYGFVDVYSHAVDQYVWEKLGGGGMFRVYCEYGTPYTQFEELVQAYEDGKTVIAVYDSSGNDMIYHLSRVEYNDSGVCTGVSFIWMGMGDISELFISSDGTVYLDQRDFEATAGK